jgi:hypothetical protein
VAKVSKVLFMVVIGSGHEEPSVIDGDRPTPSGVPVVPGSHDAPTKRHPTASRISMAINSTTLQIRCPSKDRFGLKLLAAKTPPL